MAWRPRRHGMTVVRHAWQSSWHDGHSDLGWVPGFLLWWKYTSFLLFFAVFFSSALFFFLFSSCSSAFFSASASLFFFFSFVLRLLPSGFFFFFLIFFSSLPIPLFLGVRQEEQAGWRVHSRHLGWRDDGGRRGPMCYGGWRRIRIQASEGFIKSRFIR